MRLRKGGFGLMGNHNYINKMYQKVINQLVLLLNI